MSRVFISGLGAVSPAGWDLGGLRAALAQGQPLPVQPLPRPGWPAPLRSRLVPTPAVRPAFFSHPRLRRASPITQYAAAAALEAVSRWRGVAGTRPRLGLILCLHTGCVQYSCRFLEEALKDPASASPLVFPETVFAAPASHISVLLDNTPLVCTLIGDPACFLHGVSLGTDWLEAGRVEACLVIGAEETNWVLADGLWHLEHAAIISGGAGAVGLSLNPAHSIGVELSEITNVHTFGAWNGRRAAARAMRHELPPGSSHDLLCDGTSGSPRADGAELAAWHDWKGARLSPKRILGEGLMAAAAWQCVAAVDALALDRFTAAQVSLVGSNQQAIGARFVRSAAPALPGQAALSRHQPAYE